MALFKTKKTEDPKAHSVTKRRTIPQDDSKRVRNNQVKIRLTDEEVLKLKSAASAAGMTLADFVMTGVDRERRIILPGGNKIHSELLHEGNNLNQALVLCYQDLNAGKKPDVERIFRVIDKIERNLDRLAGLMETWDIRLASGGEPNADNDM